MRSKGMSFLKFALVINIVVGALLLIGGLVMLAIGIIFATKSEDFFISFFPKSMHEDIKNIFIFINKDGMSAQQAIKHIGVDVPKILVDVLQYDLGWVMVGLGGTIATWVTLIHLVFSTFMLKRISASRRGEVNMSRLVVFLLGVLSLIPVASGILILIAGFGRKPIGTRGFRGRYPYGTRRGDYYRRPISRY